MLTISNIPNEVYEAAIIMAGMESWGLARAPEAYAYQSEKRGFESGELEKALYDCITLQGAFSEDGGRFSGCGGYRLS
jgi:hypothetical protein